MSNFSRQLLLFSNNLRAVLGDIKSRVTHMKCLIWIYTTCVASKIYFLLVVNRDILFSPYLRWKSISPFFSKLLGTMNCPHVLNTRALSRSSFRFASYNWKADGVRNSKRERESGSFNANEKNYYFGKQLDRKIFHEMYKVLSFFFLFSWKAVPAFLSGKIFITMLHWFVYRWTHRRSNDAYMPLGNPHSSKTD